ncbi:MAG: ABC transporter ATP-binding protein [Candidatus Bathyarchaeota archaeon]|nr:MAG: ABC transporter ATP-binding protein [Candidatus Bathyarchaeota archaeon]
MITLKNVSKTYEMGDTQVYALNDLNIHIDEDEFLALMGPSGSGKSTALYIIGALLTPTMGEVTINGTSIYEMSQRARARFRRENVGFIFQSFELVPYLTAIENVMLPLYLSGVPRTKHFDMAEAVIQEVGLAERAFHKPSELSGGEQQRVCIARGIVNYPSILLADEPTGNLDQETGCQIIHLLQTLSKSNGFTLIMVTHDSNIACRASRILRMTDGKVVDDQPKAIIKGGDNDSQAEKEAFKE